MVRFVWIITLLYSLTSAQEFMMGEHGADIFIALISTWREEALRLPKVLAVDFRVIPKDAKWDTSDFVKIDEQIDGFIESDSEMTRIMWMAFMIIGATILAFVYPLIAFNEFKRLTLAKIDDTIKVKLLDSKNG